MAVSAADVRAHLERLESREDARVASHVEALRARLPEAARILRDRHGASRILLFGSLAAGDPHARSDVDLAVEGVSAEGYFSALADLLGLFPSVDLVRLEDAPPTLARHIAVEGLPL